MDPEERAELNAILAEQDRIDRLSIDDLIELYEQTQAADDAEAAYAEWIDAGKPGECDADIPF